MQTVFEAEQLCAELQHSVSGLDSRLAELLHWEAEARELYQLLRATDRKEKKQGQDPRARVRRAKEQGRCSALFPVMISYFYI